jgi:cytosine/adenosine deaminase-related metal-dependent hydrolase
MPEEHVFPKHAEFINDLVMSGGLAGVGSHGQLQGLGYHWELWAMSSGGLSTLNSLRVATILGAESLGLDGDLGSIEKGKIADLLLFEENPLEDIRNTNTISYVVKNGRVYLAKDLSEVAPEVKPAPSPMWQNSKPEGLPGIKK